MRKSIFVVIAIVLTFLALIVAYTMTPPEGSDSGKASAAVAKH